MLKYLGLVAILLIPLSASAQQAAIPSTRSSANPAREECRQKVEALCPGVQPGGGRLVACLKQQGKTIRAVCPELTAAHPPQTRQSAPITSGSATTATSQTAPASTGSSTGSGAVPGDTFPSNP